MTGEKRKEIRRWKQLCLRRLFYESNRKLRLELIDTLETLELWDQGRINVVEAAERIASLRGFQLVLVDYLRHQKQVPGRQAGGGAEGATFT